MEYVLLFLGIAAIFGLAGWSRTRATIPPLELTDDSEDPKI